MARVTFEISEEGKRKLKAKASEQGKTIKEVLTEFCKEYVSELRDTMLASEDVLNRDWGEDGNKTSSV